MKSYKSIYSNEQEIAIQSEFERIKDKCYLEHAGATLYSEKQISDILSDLTGKLYANPHAKSTSSKLTEDSIDQIRFHILAHFNTNPNEYNVIFTNGATGALKLVSESFNYNNGCFVYLQDNHTSVLGMRNNSPNVEVLAHNDAFNILNKTNYTNLENHIGTNEKNSLFVYPAQCNFSGTKYPLKWIENVQNRALNFFCDSKRWYCFLDAASYASTNVLDLSKYKPDFVCISFYKIFGYPTGLGALIVKKDSEDVLLKKYYGGGTVMMAVSMKNIAIPRTVLHERFEDGTLSFLSILSLKYGFETLNRLKLNMDLISNHTFSLAKYVYNHLLTLHHSNGEPAAILYHDTTFENRTHQGAIVNFNLKRPDGRYVGYAEVLHISNLFGIQLRTGCFCNPGSCQRHLKLSTADVLKHFERGHVCGDQNDLIDGVPTGSVRVSFGYMSTKRDADEFLSMVEECFVEKPCIRKDRENYDSIKNIYLKKFYFSQGVGKTVLEEDVEKRDDKNNNANKKSKEFIVKNSASTIYGILNEIYIYPVKSCGAFKIDKTWEIALTGFKYDRQWMIVNEAGVCLTQKLNTNLCKIKTFINLETNSLELRYEDMPNISISLDISETHKLKVFPCQSKVCGDPIVGWDCGEDVSTWINDALGTKGLRLLRQSSEYDEARKKNINGESVLLSLANQAQFLLINKSSVCWLQKFLNDETSSIAIDDLISRFRPNFVVDFEKPFVENDIAVLEIDRSYFKVNGKCTRCQMICIDQNTGEKSADLLRILSREFRGKMSFGIYLERGNSQDDGQIFVNSTVLAKRNSSG